MAVKRLGGISMLFKNFTNENASEKITVKERLMDAEIFQVILCILL